MYSYLFVCAAGKVRPTIPPAETVRTTAINGNDQQHFQGDIRDDPLPLSLPFPFTPQEKAGKTRLTNRILTFFLFMLQRSDINAKDVSNFLFFIHFLHSEYFLCKLQAPHNHPCCIFLTIFIYFLLQVQGNHGLSSQVHLTLLFPGGRRRLIALAPPLLSLQEALRRLNSP